MEKRATPPWAALLLLLSPPAANAETLTGICPDGSMFIVRSAADVPCSRAKLVEPGELPPLRPELLPHPYTWLVDQETQNPNNPYNLVDRAREIRALRSGRAEGEPEVASGGRSAPLPAAEPSTAARRAPGPLVALDEEEVRGLARLVVLRQQLAPAEILVEDARGGERLRVQLAHSGALEARVLDALGRAPGEGIVLAFVARAAEAAEAAEFHPNFFVVQGSLSYRPDPSREELAFLAGEAGEIPAGAVAVGYLVAPGRFDPREPLEVYWNDRSVEAVFTP